MAEQPLLNAALPPLGRELSCLALLTLVVFCLAHFQGLVSPYAVNDDVRQQIFWMQQWSDQGLYPDDWLTDYAQRYVPLGVKALYRLADLVIHPLAFSKVLTAALFVSLGLCFHRLGEAMGGRQLGRAALIVFWFSPFFLHNMSGGLARSFAGPLLALFLLGWVKNSARIVGLAIVLQSLFIPYICVLSVAALAMVWLLWKCGKSHPPPLPQRATHFAIIGLVTALVLFYNFQLQGSGYGPMTTAADMAGHAEYSAQGRFPVFPAPSLLFEIFVRPFDRFAVLLPENALPRILSLLLLGSTILFYARRADWGAFNRHRRPFLALVAASLALYVLARIFVARLFIPSRYLEYTTAICYTLAFALCLASALDRLGSLRPSAWAWLVLVATALLAGLGLKNVSLYDYGADFPLYEAVQQLPKDVLLAGHPFLMDNVLTFGRRKVFLSYELVHPWSKGLWAKQSPRLEHLFQAYYAKDSATVLDFCRTYAIDFLVVDDRHFETEFIDNTPQTGLLCSVLDLPGPLKKLCSRLAPELKVVYETQYSATFPDAPPFFEPFRTQIQSLARPASSAPRFALLQDFPSQRIGTHIQLIDVRSLR